MKISVLIISAMFMLLSCDSDSVNTPSEPEQVEHLEGVFVLGSFGGNMGYWHDGEWNNLPVSDSWKIGRAYSLCVYEDSIYMAGYESSDGGKNYKTGYYVNNEWIQINEPDDHWSILDIEVYNNKIYCAGASGSTACYWINGEVIFPADIEGDSYASGMINSIIVENDDVIVAGDNNLYPVYWLNREPVRLSIPEELINGRLWVIRKYNENIYTAGWCRNQDDDFLTGYWKNNKWVTLTNPFSEDAIRTIVTGIEIVNDDVYVCAYSEVKIDDPFEPSNPEVSYSEFTSGYWKNGEWFELETPNGTPRAEGMVERNGDIYIVGTSFDNYDRLTGSGSASYAGYWKNGEWHPLGEEGVKTQAFDIVVK